MLSATILLSMLRFKTFSVLWANSSDDRLMIVFLLPLNCQSQQLSSALSSACDFKSHFCKQCGPRSDCSSRSSLIWVYTVCLYAKIGLKSLHENFNRGQKQTTFSDAGFLGVLRAKICMHLLACIMFEIHRPLFHVLSKFSRQEIDFVFHIFTKKSGLWYFMHIVSLETICMKCQSPFSGEKIRNIFQHVVCWIFSQHDKG